MSKEVVAVVEGDDAKAFDFIPTGVYIDGREAARLRGLDDEGNVLWRNVEGLVHLLAPTNYVLSGTNDGAEIVFGGDVADLDAQTVNRLFSAASLTCAGAVRFSELPAFWRMNVSNKGITVRRIRGTAVVFR